MPRGRKNDALKLSACAAQYERKHGEIRVPNRIARQAARDERRAHVASAPPLARRFLASSRGGAEPRPAHQ